MRKPRGKAGGACRCTDIPDGLPVIGWAAELGYGKAINDHQPDTVHVKVVVTPKGVTIAAGAADGRSAQDLLLQLGFNPDQVKKLLCG